MNDSFEEKEEVSDVGVIVGRFQVAELHQGHKILINSVVQRHKKVLMFLGLSHVKSSLNNPLDFEARKQMILQEFPEINVLYIKDNVSDKIWSQHLDERINDLITPSQTVTLYGSRDSFIRNYHGSFPCKELKQSVFVSGKEIRKQIHNSVKASKEFREGVIWATSNQWPKCYSTIDCAIIDSDRSRILFGQKRDEDMFRFIGGFVQPGHTLEETVRKEVYEETHLEISDPKYLSSFVIDDWRYRGEQDKITTSLFYAFVMFGRPEPDDDIHLLKWFPIVDNRIMIDIEQMMPAHKKLLECIQMTLPTIL